VRPWKAGALLLVIALVPAAFAVAGPTFTIRSRSLTSVYLDAGRAGGLTVGDRLRVMSGDTAVAELEVTGVAEESTSCKVLSQLRPVRIGDLAVRVERGAALTTTVGAGRVPAPPALAGFEGKASAPPAAALAPLPAAAGPSAAAVRTATAAPLAPPVAAAEPARPAPAPSPVAARGPSFTVKYRSAANVYLDAGGARGLSVGDRLQVVVGGAAVAELEVVYVAEQSASCKVISEARPVHAGDTARLSARATTPAAAGGTTSPPVPLAAAETATSEPAPADWSAGGRSSAAPWAHVRGAASFGYYKSWDQTGSALGFEERTARVDLGLDDIAGQPLSFTLRARSRQDVRARMLSEQTPQDERTDQLYEVALRYAPPSDHFGLEFGRIGIYRFVGVGYLDGLLARYRPLTNVQVGVFGGRVADIEGLGFGGTGSKYGGFVRLVPGGRYALSGYDATLAYVKENADGDVSREYLSLESRFASGSRWSLSERAELDLNRGWRQELTGKSYQFSNVSFSGNLQVASSAWAFATYDGQRNYRYYLNRQVPETVFDDLLHQGLRAGLSYLKAGGFGASVGFGMSLKEPDPRIPDLNRANAYSFNCGLHHADLFSSGYSVGIDGTGFSNGYTDGGLVSARLGRRFAAGHMLDLSYGRSFYHVKDTGQDRTTQWLRLLGRGELGHRVYLQGNVEYDTGDDLKGPRGFLELGVLF
jgi:hypothetical protein